MTFSGSVVAMEILRGKQHRKKQGISEKQLPTPLMDEYAPF
jgi:hypothetical protein